MPQVGDIVTLWGAGERKVVVNVRTEIVPMSGDWSKTEDMQTRVVFQLAGKNDRWFTEKEIELLSPRNP
jgi:hypothetical protein